MSGVDLEQALADALDRLSRRNEEPVTIWHPSQVKHAVARGILSEGEADYLLPDWRER